MDRDEAISLLRGGKEGIQQWNQRREEEKIPSIDHVDLSGTNLFGVDLVQADLRDANLVDANLSGAVTIGADFSGSNLTDADLSEADLGGAGFIRANLNDTNVSGAILSGANLSGANLSGAILRDAHLIGANLSGANLFGADLFQADLRDANLSQANLSYALLVGTNVRGANFSNACFGWTVLANVDLWQAAGLDTIRHLGPSEIGGSVLYRSHNKMPAVFLRGCGVPERLITHLESPIGAKSEIHPASCFISYDHQDKSFARRLHDQLQGRGIRCWLNEKQLFQGDDICEQLDRGIRLPDKVLFCASEHSLTSRWVEQHLEQMFKREQRLTKEHGHNVSILILLDLDGYILDKWRSRKKDSVLTRLIADSRGWEKDNTTFDQAFEQIVMALRMDEAVRETPQGPKL